MRDPTRTVAVGQVELPSAATVHLPATIRPLSWSGGYLFAATDRYRDGVAIFDMRDAGHPVMAGSIAAGDVQEAVLDGCWLQVVTPSVVKTYDVSTPSAPTLAASWKAPVIWQTVLSATAAGGRIVITDYDSGVRVVDIHVPAALVDAGAFQPPHKLQGFALRGNELYATDFNGAFRTFDVADPARPRLVGQLLLRNDVEATHPALDRLLVGFSDGEFSLDVIDVTHPRRSLAVGILTAADARAIADRDDVVFVGSYGNGLTGYRFRPPAGPSATATAVRQASRHRLSMPWLGGAAAES